MASATSASNEINNLDFFLGAAGASAAG